MFFATLESYSGNMIISDAVQVWSALLSSGKVIVRLMSLFIQQKLTSIETSGSINLNLDDKNMW